MIETIKRIKNHIIARRRGQIAGHVWFDPEKAGDVLRNSPVPGVVMLTLVWMVCTVLLTLSYQKQHDVSDWIIGQRVPYSVIAQCNFSFRDLEATEAKKQEARESAPEFFRIDSSRSNDISKRFNNFWMAAKELHDSRKNQRNIRSMDLFSSTLAKECSKELISILGEEYLAGQKFNNANERLKRIISSGIIRSSDKQSRISGKQIKTINSLGHMSSGKRLVGDMPDAVLTGIWIADAMFPDTESQKELHDEFAAITAKIIGEDGNLDYDDILSKNAASSAADAVPEVVSSRAKGDLLIRKGDIYTPVAQQMLTSARKAMPRTDDIGTVVQHIVWTLVLLMVVSFLITRLFPKIIRDTRRIVLAGTVIIISLLANYWALRFFDYLVREGRIQSQEFIIDAVPVVLSAVTLTVLTGYRVALASSFIVVSVTAMMIMPDRSFELAMRWMATGAVAGLAVCKVKNYRAYFIRIFLITVPMTVAISAGGLQWQGAISRETLSAMIIIASLNAFCSAVLALVQVFVLELVFNIDTDMALMVLSDLSHPLLERLKREAPGTMFHSMTVATLAEDAAKSIGANPLRAKVGGLFHDIGKLSMPMYFVENNRDSSSEHLKLNPQLSSIIIRDHVKEGLILARQYHLYRWISGAISTHHGDDLVRYFYNAAQKQRQDSNDASPVIESQFRYTGRPPRAKELVIVSLADACEAATRSLVKPTPAKIEAMVEDIFLMRYQGGQLRNADLTLAELDSVKECFIKTLNSIYHGRIAYTPEELNAENILQVEKSQSSQAE